MADALPYAPTRPPRLSRAARNALNALRLGAQRLVVDIDARDRDAWHDAHERLLWMPIRNEATRRAVLKTWELPGTPPVEVRDLLLAERIAATTLLLGCRLEPEDAHAEYLGALVEWALKLPPALQTESVRALDAAREVFPTDPFSPCIEYLLARIVRHGDGVYFTPPALAATLVQVADPAKRARIIEPGCGCGALLLATLDRLVAKGVSATRALKQVAGIERDPLLAWAARANLQAWAVRHSVKPATAQDACANAVAIGDLLLAEAPLIEPGDAVVTNPPWVSWGHLDRAYRRRLASDVVPRYPHVAPERASDRDGSMNDDLLVLYLAVVLDRYLQNRGRLTVLAKHSLLTAPANRAFRAGRAHASLTWGVTRALDLRKTGAFGFENEAAILQLRRSGRTTFPVSGQKGTECTECGYWPTDPRDPGAPWRQGTAGETPSPTHPLESGHPLAPRHGFKSDAAAVYQVEVLDVPAPGCARVCNRPEVGRHRHPAPFERDIEDEWLFPLVRSRDVQPWRLSGSDTVLVPQRGAKPQPEDAFREAFPDTWAYLNAHRDILESRRSPVFHGVPFFAVYGVGPYTFSEWKVVWVGMGFSPRSVAVAGPRPAWPEGPVRPCVPDGACYSLASRDRREAAFLCALILSDPVQAFLRTHSGRSKRGMAASLMRQIRLPAFDPANASHQALANAAMALTEVDDPADVEVPVLEQAARLLA